VPAIAFDNTYARELEGFHVPWKPAAVPEPRLLFLNLPLAEELGLDPAALSTPDSAALWTGNALPEGAQPIAQAYAGHQFGGFSPQLGDGRALLLGEVLDRHGLRRDIAFKGSGRTPFSRGGDGKAAVGPMLREVLISEALHALGIPTTRALAVAGTGERVVRERVLPGAVLTRVAASHLRVGTFQYFAARRETEHVRQLADYAIARHDPALRDIDSAPERTLAFFRAVARRQAALLAQWMNVGFIHGVMNTDNMTISGESIDFGPCAFMEAYDPEAVFSSIDHGGRYAYANQPHIARWNLARLAETLLPLIDDDPQRAVERATEVLDAFPGWFEAALRRGQRAKLGLLDPGSSMAGRGAIDEALGAAGPSAGSAGLADLRRGALDSALDTASEAASEVDPHAETDDALAGDWLDLLHQQRVDFTQAWRFLADEVACTAAEAARTSRLRPLFAEPGALEPWLARWRERLAQSDGQAPSAARYEAAAAMRRTSPWIIPRNHRVEEALAAASDHGDLAPFERLLQALRRPFDEHPEDAPFAEPAPAEVTACYRTFCGT
jgi:serine/tyrosine/threonine adenylyltransferase